MIINKEIPVSAAALIALIFAVPLILYIWVLEPKPPTHDICKNKNSEYRGYYKTRFNIKIQLFHSRNTLQLFLKISRKRKREKYKIGEDKENLFLFIYCWVLHVAMRRCPCISFTIWALGHKRWWPASLGWRKLEWATKRSKRSSLKINQEPRDWTPNYFSLFSCPYIG